MLRDDPLYVLWLNIKAKCLHKTNAGYKYYGGRGITVYVEWIDNFPAFRKYIVDTIGERPEGLTLDRKDNDGHYEPGNLRWATRADQVANRRLSVVVTNTGEPHIYLHGHNQKYSVAKPGGGRVQNIGNLQEACTIRNQLWNLYA